jgi:acetyl-CoA C-acetyltransferase
MTTFRSEATPSIDELMNRAASRALGDADCDGDAVTSVHVGNMAAEAFNRTSGLANALVASIGVHGASADRIENTSASGASAFLRGYEAVASGHSDVALVVGVEKMSAVETSDATEIIGRILHEREYAQGLTLPSLAALAAETYLRRYDASRDALTAIAMKNHANGAQNPDAQFQRRVSAQDVKNSPLVADPLRLFDCCPMSDGSAALVLARTTPTEGDVLVSSAASATDTHAVAERRDPIRVDSARKAGERAFDRGGLGPTDVDVACLHDAFTILELLELEELGFFERGTAWEATLSGATRRDGSLPVNPGGGLKARGHPLGATGVAQLVELTRQLTNRADGRQVLNAKTGLAINVAGFGNNSVCTILQRYDD